jgi:hypothetical protein
MESFKYILVLANGLHPQPPATTTKHPSFPPFDDAGLPAMSMSTNNDSGYGPDSSREPTPFNDKARVGSPPSDGTETATVVEGMAMATAPPLEPLPTVLMSSPVQLLNALLRKPLQRLFPARTATALPFLSARP